MTDLNTGSSYLQHPNELDVIFNAMTDPILVYDEKGFVVKINAAGIASLGFDPTGLKSSDLAERVLPQQPDSKKIRTREIISSRVLKGEVIKDFNYVLKTPQGGKRICSCSVSPISVGGRIKGAVCTWRDITKYRSRETLHDSERNRLRGILDAIQDGIYICNKDYTIEYTNPAIRKYMGDPAGKRCYEYIYKGNGKCSWCKLPDTFSGKTIRWEWFDPKSGKAYDLIDTPFYNSDGSVSKLTIFHDITESKKREKSLSRDKNELLNKVDKINTELVRKSSDLKDTHRLLKYQSEIIEKLFANTHFLIALLDTEFTFIRVNKTYADADGRREDFFIGKNHFDLYPNEENKAIFNKVLETGEPYITYAKPFVYSENPERGTTYWNWSLNPVIEEDGEVTALILILMDVTVRIKTQMELSEAKRLSDIGALATTVAHELRSPLGVIQGTVYNVKKKTKDEKLIENMNRIERKIDECEKIINNLLNYSRIKQPELKKIHLYNFLHECLNDIKRQKINSKTEIIEQFEPLNGITVQIDPFQIRQVFMNVFDNAFQALPDNKGNIVVKGFMDRGCIRIDIRDSGEGIDREDLVNIFEPFFTKKSKGTGLGLTICRELINLHKGGIEIESEKGKGTVVHIRLLLETGSK